jgi:hypothetical protein
MLLTMTPRIGTMRNFALTASRLRGPAPLVDVLYKGAILCLCFVKKSNIMHDMVYTFGDATTTWVCVHVERDIHTDGAKWAEFDRQASSIAQLNDTLLAQGVP